MNLFTYVSLSWKKVESLGHGSPDMGEVFSVLVMAAKTLSVTDVIYRHEQILLVKKLPE